MSAGYSDTPLPRKLGIKPGANVALVGFPGSLEKLLGSLEPSVRLRSDLRARGPYDVIVVFVTTESDLRRRFAAARAKLRTAGGLWVAWPKRSSPLATDLKESHVRAHGLAEGLVDNKICAIDDDWSGLRFVVRLQDRRG